MLRQHCVQTTAKHPGAVKRTQQKTPNHKRVVKKRDIRTSFLRTPVAPVLNPPPAAPQQPAAAVPVLLPPAVALPGDSSPALPASPLVTISLGEACSSTIAAPASSTFSSSRLAGEPVVASLALALEAPTVTDSLHTGFNSSSSSASSSDDEDPLWGSQGGLNSLAALDRALNGLILAPAGVSSNSGSSSKPSSSGAISSSSKSSKSSSSKRSSSSSSAAAAAGPAMMSIYCEGDWERELAAAAAHQQLLVVKVEAAQSLMRSSSRVDPTLRFQTNNSLPTALNTYAPHPELLSSFSLLGSAGPATPATFTSAYDFAPASLRGSSSSVVAAAAVSSSSQACQLDSPVHQWYQQLAGQYSSSRLRFLSLQSDAPRAKALCRRLGVGGPLSVLLVEPGSGRQVLQLVGNKVEAELPAALLYFGDVDAAGAAPSQLLPQLTSKEQLEAHTSSADLSVVAFHMHAAPPCVRSYSRIYEAARSSAGSIPFAVMDVDSSEACTALSNELGLERLPTLVVYKGGKEVCRLEKSSERKQLQEVLQQQVAASTAVAAA
uniref:Thioredoxin domain-containing protein n=1 Tax=Tetradesmus obliquus TaxID=3088 RepID=A0A383WFA0_TETOB|eukprot:jgi/Sobl393_1/19379/SZX76101.1